jgi:hypothetical protein
MQKRIVLAEAVGIPKAVLVTAEFNDFLNHRSMGWDTSPLLLVIK